MAVNNMCDRTHLWLKLVKCLTGVWDQIFLFVLLRNSVRRILLIVKACMYIYCYICYFNPNLLFLRLVVYHCRIVIALLPYQSLCHCIYSCWLVSRGDRYALIYLNLTSHLQHERVCKNI